MLTTFSAIPTLLLGIGLLLAGNGFLGTLLAVRATDAGFSNWAVGVVMSGYFAGFVAGTYFCPRLVSRVGHIRTFASLAAITSTAAVLHGFAVHPLAWLLLRVTVGFCLVGIYMVIESWMNVLADPASRGDFFSTYMTVALASLGGGQFLLLFNGDYPLVPFALASMLFTLGLVPVVLTRVPEPKPVPEAPSLRLKNLFAVSPTGVVGTAVAGVLTGAFWGLAPLFARGMEQRELGIALFMGGTVFGGVALQWPIGHFSDTRDRRRVLTSVATFGALVALALFASAGILPALLPVLGFLLGGLLFPVYSLSVAQVNDGLGPEEMLEGTRGLLLLNGIGAAVGPLLAGGLMEAYGARTLMVFLAAAFVLLAVYGLRQLATTLPVPVEEQGEFVALTRTSTAVLEMLPTPGAETGENGTAGAD